MNIEPCPRESIVLEALASGGLDVSLKRHLQECQWCADAAAAGLFAGRWAAQPVAEPVLPSPEILRLRARLQARESAAKRAQRPLAVAETVGVVVALLCAVAGMIWKWSAFQALVVQPVLMMQSQPAPMAGAVLVLFILLLLVPPVILYFRLPETK